jgi:hypothetical protein
MHHSSHRQLLAEVPAGDAAPARVDAVLVPAARPVQWLREAMKLTKELGTGLLVLCSKRLTAADAANLADELDVPAVAVDVGRNRGGLPAFTTTRLLEQRDFVRQSDTSAKRNLALYMARLAGWERVLFVDDDITDIDPVDARAAAGLLDDFEVVGLNNIGAPDNSVVCHVHRELGNKQAQFIGGGGMAVAPMRKVSFFPEIFNEDWFYMLGTGEPLRVAATGQMTQEEHDFLGPKRADSEELGDCLAEGLFWLLDQGLATQSADEAHWREFLGRRGYFIGHLHTEVAKCELGPDLAKRFITSLDGAWRKWMAITSDLCTEFVWRWRIDLEIWRSFLEKQPVGLALSEALEYARWQGVVKSRVPWPADR